MQTLDLGNNETLYKGIFTNSDGTFTVLTYTKSWTYKTEKGAVKKWNNLVSSGLI